MWETKWPPPPLRRTAAATNSCSEGTSDVLMLANGPKLIFLVRDQSPTI
jgi:hypothetical protein